MKATLVAWCRTHSNADEADGFTVVGLLRLARRIQPAQASVVLDSLPEAASFQIVRDTFVALRLGGFSRPFVCRKDR